MIWIRSPIFPAIFKKYSSGAVSPFLKFGLIQRSADPFIPLVKFGPNRWSVDPFIPLEKLRPNQRSVDSRFPLYKLRPNRRYDFAANAEKIDSTKDSEFIVEELKTGYHPPEDIPFEGESKIGCGTRKFEVMW